MGQYRRCDNYDEVIELVKCCKCKNTATWKATDTIVALDTPFLCNEHMQTVSVTERLEDNPCFQRIIEVNEIKKVIV